jgi:hypothetical protein
MAKVSRKYFSTGFLEISYMGIKIMCVSMKIPYPSSSLWTLCKGLRPKTRLVKLGKIYRDCISFDRFIENWFFFFVLFLVG